MCAHKRWRADTSARLLLTGGSIAGRTSEAAVMRDWLVSRGVPVKQLLLEDQAQNTFENVVYTCALLPAATQLTLVLVSEGYHLPRCRFLMRVALARAGRAATITTAAADNPPNAWAKVPHEALAIVRDVWRLLQRHMTIPKPA